jgi:hypothetical protein
LNDENVHYLVEKLENLDVNNIDVDTVNDVVLNCNSIIKNAADKADMIVEFKHKKRPSVGSKKCKPYFNQDCYLKRKEYRKCRNLHWRLQRAETKENLIVSSREYKCTLNTQFREYQKSVIDKLKNLCKSDSKAYWSFINKCDTKGNKAVNTIAIDVLHDHFKNAVKSLKNNKACGGDLILNEFLKHATVKLK